MNHIQFCLSRPGEDTFAVIEASSDDPLIPSRVMEALIDATTAFVKSTEEGKELWERSSEDLNIGDLWGHGIPPGILAHLNQLGIKNFKVDVFHCSDHPLDYVYDTVLVREGDLVDE